MVFQFEHITAFHDEKLGKWKSKDVDFSVLKSIFTKWQVALDNDGWNSLFLNNHDLPRMVSKYGNDTTHRVESAKMLATMIHMMKGTPYIYQGEEIGMTNVSFDSLTNYRDVETINAYNEHVGVNLTHEEMMTGIKKDGRDNARTPFQWDSSMHGGFTKGKPWINTNENYVDINVKNSVNDPYSILNYYKKLISLRKNHDVIIYGDFKEYIIDDNLYVYERSYMDENILVILNHSSNEVKINLFHTILAIFCLCISFHRNVFCKDNPTKIFYLAENILPCKPNSCICQTFHL